MSDRRLNPYETVLLWMLDATGNERTAVLWFYAWTQSLEDENEREGQL